MEKSEIGHLNIGAGEIVYTGLSLIGKEIQNGKFKLNKFFNKKHLKMFDRNGKAYQATLGKVDNIFNSSIDYVNEQYKENISNEFLIPTINPNAKFVNNRNSIIFFNFRPDWAIQLTHLFIGSNNIEVKPSITVKNNKCVLMMKYEGLDTIVAYSEMEVKNPIGKVIADAGLEQLRLAETQKYAHVTFLWLWELM